MLTEASPLPFRPIPFLFLLALLLSLGEGEGGIRLDFHLMYLSVRLTDQTADSGSGSKIKSNMAPPSFHLVSSAAFLPHVVSSALQIFSSPFGYLKTFVKDQNSRDNVGYVRFV